MLHPDREFAVIDIESLNKLAMILTGFTWPLCTGFEHHDLLFLNDTTSEDDAQEYAVIRDGHQVESITFGWCSAKRAGQHIRRLLAGETENLGPVEPITKQVEGHTCPLCQ